MPRPPARRSATCRPAFPTCCARGASSPTRPNSAQRNAATELDEATYRIDYNRRPETDMEVCMPMQTLELFAKGRGVWSGLAREAAAEQLAHMAGLLEELYPSFRLFLFDGRERFSIPYTIFGPYRAAIYVGDMYMVLNTREPVRTMTRHFDGLIRVARVNAHEAAAHVRRLNLGWPNRRGRFGHYCTDRSGRSAPAIASFPDRSPGRTRDRSRGPFPAPCPCPSSATRSMSATSFCLSLSCRRACRPPHSRR